MITSLVGLLGMEVHTIDGLFPALREVTFQAHVTLEAMSAVPSGPDTITHFVEGFVGRNGSNSTNDLVSWNAG